MSNREWSGEQLAEILPIMREMTEKYTAKDSSSITYEMAEQLAEAIVYCMQEVESSAEEEPGENGGEKGNIPALKKEGGSEISAAERYHRGYALVVKKVERARDVYNRMMEGFCDYGNRTYSDTIVKGMPQFFLRYDARFCPQNHLLTLDYPIFMAEEGRCGIDLIEPYLLAVSLEQQFLAKFPESYVVVVLNRYHGDYKSLVLNVCRVVLRNTLGHMLVGKPLKEQGFSQEEYKNAEALIGGCSREELRERLETLLHALVERTYNGSEVLYLYLSLDLDDFTFELLNAAQLHSLEHLLVL